MKKFKHRSHPLLSKALKLAGKIERALHKKVDTNKQTGKIEDSKNLYTWATAIKEFEGWHPGSKSYRNNNPGNLRWSKFQDGTRDGYAYFNSYEKGWEALVFQLRIAANGKSKVYKPNMSIHEFVNVWAPPIDDNHHNDRYAKHIANALGVSVNYKIGNIV